ncbi:MAG: hypothetical protein R2860_16450 [Desulfobacterales bacterium]
MSGYTGPQGGMLMSGNNLISDQRAAMGIDDCYKKYKRAVPVVNKRRKFLLVEIGGIQPRSHPRISRRHGQRQNRKK